MTEVNNIVPDAAIAATVADVNVSSLNSIMSIFTEYKYYIVIGLAIIAIGCYLFYLYQSNSITKPKITENNTEYKIVSINEKFDDKNDNLSTLSAKLQVPNISSIKQSGITKESLVQDTLNYYCEMPELETSHASISIVNTDEDEEDDEEEEEKKEEVKKYNLSKEEIINIKKNLKKK